MNKINFIANKPWLNQDSKSSPIPASKHMPDWYKKAERYVKYPDGTTYLDQDNNKIPSWKACPAIYDIFMTGYFLRTPCDIKFIKSNNRLEVVIEDQQHKDFVQIRQEMPGFEQPDGYYKDHFAWWPDWAPAVEEGYCVLYAHPFNRFDLPFLNTTGIVDQDKLNLPGTVPFFIKEGWEGVIKAGTPFLQMLPFKRENWESEYTQPGENDIIKRNVRNIKKYRKPNGGVYLNSVWEKRKYI